MHYTIYKTTNKINGKIYIGKHQTLDLDDDYMGSGKLLAKAISNYGIENFTKEILYVFDNETEMNAKEAEMVNEEFVGDANTYNLCHGGHGGFSYINGNGLRGCHNNETWDKISDTLKGRSPSENTLKGLRLAHAEGRMHKLPSFEGKSHTDKTKKKIGNANSLHQSGEKNSQFGSMWITNGIENKKIHKNAVQIPEGWYKGRKLK
jgi:group I intron endonuclease